MRKLETGRLTMRNFTESDWTALKEIIVRYQSSPYAVYDHQWPTSDDELKKIAKWFASGDEFLAVCLKDTGHLIGYIAINKTPLEGQYNIGYCFSSDYHGKGYAIEGCRAMVDYTFFNLNAERIITGTAVDNHPSCRLLSRLGLRMIRQEVSSFRKDENGKPIEFAGGVFELTRADWKLNRETTHLRAPNEENGRHGRNLSRRFARPGLSWR